MLRTAGWLRTRGLLPKVGAGSLLPNLLGFTEVTAFIGFDTLTLNKKANITFSHIFWCVGFGATLVNASIGTVGFLEGHADPWPDAHVVSRNWEGLMRQGNSANSRSTACHHQRGSSAADAQKVYQLLPGARNLPSNSAFWSAYTLPQTFLKLVWISSELIDSETFWALSETAWAFLGNDLKHVRNYSETSWTCLTLFKTCRKRISIIVWTHPETSLKLFRHFPAGADRIQNGELHCKAADTMYVLRWLQAEMTQVINAGPVALMPIMPHDVLVLIAGCGACVL